MSDPTTRSHEMRGLVNAGSSQPTREQLGVEISQPVKSTSLAITASDASGSLSSYYYNLGMAYRWRMLILFTLLVILLGPQINTTALGTLMTNSGVYKELCTNLSESVTTCPEQKAALSELDSLAVSMVFCFTIFAGIFLDALGPKVCTLIGITLQFAGWLLLLFSSKSFNGYPIGITFLNAGADPFVFGFLSLANLFPSNTAIIIAVLGAARSLSCGLPAVANFVVEKGWINLNFTVYCYIFIGITALGWLLVALWLPFQPFPRLPRNASLDRKDSEEKIPYTDVINVRPRLSWLGFKSGVRSAYVDFIGSAFSWHYALFLLLPMITLVRLYFFSSIFRSSVSSDISAFYSLLNPFSFIPCLVFGILAEKVSPSFVIAFLGCMSGCTTSLILINKEAFDYTLVVMNFLCISFFASQFYCYVGALYPQKVMGKLSGVALSLGGVVSLTTRYYSFPRGNANHMIACIAMTTISAVAVILALILLIFYERPQMKLKKAAAQKLAPYSSRSPKLGEANADSQA